MQVFVELCANVLCALMLRRRLWRSRRDGTRQQRQHNNHTYFDSFAQLFCANSKAIPFASDTTKLYQYMGKKELKWKYNYVIAYIRDQRLFAVCAMRVSSQHICAIGFFAGIYWCADSMWIASEIIANAKRFSWFHRPPSLEGARITAFVVVIAAIFVFFLKQYECTHAPLRSINLYSNTITNQVDFFISLIMFLK